MSRLSFSQRMGFTPSKPPLQVDSLDDKTRMDLWNLFYSYFNGEIGNSYISYLSDRKKTFCARIWINILQSDLSELYDTDQIKDSINNYIRSDSTPWYKVLDFFEYLIQENRELHNFFTPFVNQVFESNNVGYRVIGEEITPITNQTELEAINAALNLPSPFDGAKEHIATALKHFSDKKNPDYRNSIKESISAVESVCMVLENDPSASLGQALKHLEDHGVAIHSCLKSGFSKLYGYTSDEGGIRHAMIEESASVSQEDALFMLVSCSAFCHYLQQKASKAGLI